MKQVASSTLALVRLKWVETLISFFIIIFCSDHCSRAPTSTPNFITLFRSSDSYINSVKQQSIGQYWLPTIADQMIVAYLGR